MSRNGKRGRPSGYRMSEESKRAISSSKMGQRHKQTTKDKISKTLTIYFRSLHPLSTEIANRYCRIECDDFDCWLEDSRDDIDRINDVMTERIFRNSRKIELAYGPNIEFFSHEMTPELLLLIKEECLASGMSPEDVDSLI